MVTRDSSRISFSKRTSWWYLACILIVTRLLGFRFLVYIPLRCIPISLLFKLQFLRLSFDSCDCDRLSLDSVPRPHSYHIRSSVQC
ncbi:hypothetical protein K474DRAFT_138955 [Panus rudis PR-1116 ss-1]|nr:hypothetical protein K474DRAFT_138955 [Panus rudis PR-1116 ss-1]